MIAVGLPKSALQRWVGRLPQFMHAWPSHYEGLPSQMPNCEVFIVGTVWCSCDLFNHRKSDDKVYESYQQKGWSEAKIMRAMSDRKKADRHAGLHPELRHWLADAAVDAGEAYIFIHWNSDELKYDQQASMLPDEIRNEITKVKEEILIHIIKT